MSGQIPVRHIRIKTFLEMWRDGLLSYGSGDPETAIEKATSTFVYASGDDAGQDVPNVRRQINPDH